MLAVLIVLMATLSPASPAAAVRAYATSIAAVTDDPGEAAELLVIAHAETTLRLAGRGVVPFGLTCCRRRLRGATLDDHARLALEIMRTARRVCGPHPQLRHGFYRTGVCSTDSQAAFRARLSRVRERAIRLALPAPDEAAGIGTGSVPAASNRITD